MMIFGLRPGQRVRIGDGITIRIEGLNAERVRLGFDAPKSIEIDRVEVRRRKEARRREAAGTNPPSNKESNR